MVGAFAVIVCASLVVTLQFSRARHRELALGMARAFFQTMVAARRWSAEQGGLYVPVTPTLQPNPYLEDPLRDVSTTGGMRLTKVNPAYMTRLISAEIAAAAGVRYRLTSLKPIRPGNAPDAWETAALESFERGVTEMTEVVGTGETETYRYVAPLAVEEACMQCHAAQGYEVGDVRGGLSVSFPYRPFSVATASDWGRLIAAHAIVLVLGLLLLATLGRRLVAAVSGLTASIERIEALEGMLPICAGCKSIRVDDVAGGDPRWVSVEAYLGDKTHTTFSHGLCPDCVAELYPSLQSRRNG
jgi:hypothetical protein